jgi:hypothetical protein
VIQVRNEKRPAYDGRANTDLHLANDEVGIVAIARERWLNVVLAGRPGLRVGFSGHDFSGGKQAPAVRTSRATTNHPMALAASSPARRSLRDDRDVLAANPALK